MKFKEILLQGTLIKRYKRFFVDIKYKNQTIIAHCPNSGSMRGLLNKGNKVYFSKADNPKRKLKYTLEMIEVEKKLIGVNTHLSNKIVLEGLKSKKITELIKFNDIQTEVKFSDNTRFDFMISNSNKKCFLEVKNVTMCRESKVAEFPDSITSRGTKHLNELVNAKKKGYESYILYLIQREDCKTFKIATDIDKNYKIAFDKALKSKVNVLCYACKLSNKEVKISNQINYE
jgi:sugar fermentation stimulation protein A